MIIHDIGKMIGRISVTLKQDLVINRRRKKGYLPSDDVVNFYDPPFQVAPKVAAAMLRRGVIARAMPEGDIIGFAPPLVITEAEIDRLAGTFREALHEVLPA